MSDEIHTTDILRAALSANKDCFIPRYIGPVMDMVKLHSWEDFLNLPETSWKIKQPADDDMSRESAADAGGLDLMLVPGLAFTRSGQRLGRGKGYYDRYLCQYRQTAGMSALTTIALAFRQQIVDDIPTSEHDVVVDMVLFDDS